MWGFFSLDYALSRISPFEITLWFSTIVTDWCGFQWLSAGSLALASVFENKENKQNQRIQKKIFHFSERERCQQGYLPWESLCRCKQSIPLSESCPWCSWSSLSLNQLHRTPWPATCTHAHICRYKVNYWLEASDLVFIFSNPVTLIKQPPIPIVYLWM